MILRIKYILDSGDQIPQHKKTFDAFAIDYSYKIEKKTIVMGGQSFTYLVKNHFKNKKQAFPFMVS